MRAWGDGWWALQELVADEIGTVLGVVLGPILDKNLRRGMVLSDGSLEPFLTRPISAVLALLTLIVIVLSFKSLRQTLASLLLRLLPGQR